MTLHARQPAPQGCFSPVREVCSLILNSESPKSPAHPVWGTEGQLQVPWGPGIASGSHSLGVPAGTGAWSCSALPCPSPASLLCLLPQTPPREGVCGAWSIPALPASSEGPGQGDTHQKWG